MKKFVYLLALLICLSCTRNYRCEMTYEVVYPDTTWINTYVFDGSSQASYTKVTSKIDGRSWLEIHPNGATFPCKTICVVPNKESDIKVLDFKMYHYGIDIKKKK